MIAKIGQGVFMGLLVLSLYFRIGGNWDEGDIPTVSKNIQNMAGCNFFLIVGTLMNWLFGSIITF